MWNVLAWIPQRAKNEAKSSIRILCWEVESRNVKGGQMEKGREPIQERVIKLAATNVTCSQSLGTI